MKIVSVLLTDRVLLVVPGSVVLGDKRMLKDDTDTEENNSVLTGTTTLVDVNNDVLENSTVSRGPIVEDISIVLDGSMLIDSNSVDVNDIIDLREDVVLIGNVALRGSVMLEIVFAKLVALLEIIADVITLLNDIADTEENNSVLTGTTTLVDVNNDVLENSTVSRGPIVEDISIVLDGSILIDSNSVDVNDIIDLREDIVLIGNVALRGSVMLEIVFAKLVALLEIIVDVITLLNDITVFIADCGISVILVDNVVWKLVDVNIVEVVTLAELIIPNDGDTLLAEMQASFKPIHSPLAKLKVHSVTCLLVWPPNINPSWLTLASELHNK